jgi:hypothetical protein
MGKIASFVSPFLRVVFVFLLVEEGGVVLILHLLRSWADGCFLFSAFA